MIKITIESEGNTSQLKIEGVSEQILLTDVIPSIQKGTPALAKATAADVIKNVLSQMLRTFVRQKVKLWKDN